MRHFIYLLLSAALCSAAMAQESNVLGLPAVPQKGANGAPLPAAPLIRDVDNKAILSGGMQMASSYLGKLSTVRVTTIKAFTTAQDKTSALAAARLMQRDVPLSCVAQCKSAPMPEPKILPDGRAQFDLVIDGFPRVLDSDDMINMIKGVPLAQRAGKPSPTAAASKPAAAASAPKVSSLPVTSTSSTPKVLTATAASASSQ